MSKLNKTPVIDHNQIAIQRIKNFLSACKAISDDPRVIEIYINDRMEEAKDKDLEWGLMGTELKSLIMPATEQIKNTFIMMSGEYRAEQKKSVKSNNDDLETLLTLEEVSKYFPSKKSKSKHVTDRTIRNWIVWGWLKAVTYLNDENDLCIDGVKPSQLKEFMNEVETRKRKIDVDLLPRIPL